MLKERPGSRKSEAVNAPQGWAWASATGSARAHDDHQTGWVTQPAWGDRRAPAYGWPCAEAGVLVPRRSVDWHAAVRGSARGWEPLRAHARPIQLSWWPAASKPQDSGFRWPRSRSAPGEQWPRPRAGPAPGATALRPRELFDIAVWTTEA